LTELSKKNLEVAVMGVWRPKQEESKTMWFRVPASLKKEFEDLRQQAEAEGLDAAATFTAALGRLAKQLREELPQTKAVPQEVSGKVKVNGLDHEVRPQRSGAA
jgi:adenine-specific DNA methylase